ncbi:MAG: hypothetical protein AABW48_04780, partial [Nanoarchaeota archaeon]
MVSKISFKNFETSKTRWFLYGFGNLKKNKIYNASLFLVWLLPPKEENNGTIRFMSDTFLKSLTFF